MYSGGVLAVKALDATSGSSANRQIELLNVRILRRFERVVRSRQTEQSVLADDEICPLFLGDNAPQAMRYRETDPIECLQRP